MWEHIPDARITSKRIWISFAVDLEKFAHVEVITSYEHYKPH